MVFNPREFIDDQFVNFQKFINELSSSVPIVDLRDIKDQKEFIRALVVQNKAYAQKIFDLFDELANESPANGHKGKEVLDTSKSFERRSSGTPYGQAKASPFPDDNHDEKVVFEVTHLKGKVDYLNELYMQAKKQNEESSGIIKNLKQELEALKESQTAAVSNEDKEVDPGVQELIEQNQRLVEQINALTADKDGVEKDLEELIKEFANVKEQYEAEVKNIRAEKERQLSDLKKKTALKETPHKSIIESNHIPELNEEIEELKEKLEQKEKIIVELRNQSNNPNQENAREENSSELQTRILELSIRLRELRAVLLNLCAKSEILVEDRNNSPAVIKEDAVDLVSFIEREHLYVVEGLRKMAIDLLNQPARQVVITRNSNDRSATDFTIQFREHLEKIQAEIEEKLRLSMVALSDTNHSELVARLEEEIDTNTILKEKVEKLSFNIQKVLLAVQEELDRLSLIHEYDRKTVTIEEFRTQITACKEKVAEMLDPGLKDKLTLNEEYENQRRLWQEKISQQTIRFTEESKRLREELENQKNVTIAQEKDLTDQITVIRMDYEDSQRKHRAEVEDYQDKISYLEQEKDSLNRYIDGLKESKVELQNIITEREETILDYTNKVAEWQAKCSFIENDIRKTLNEKNKIQDLVFEKDKEIDILKEERYDFQANIDKLSTAIVRFERIQEDNERELAIKTEKMLELESAFEQEKQRLWEQNDQINNEYRNYVEETERTTEQLKDNYENLIREYTIQLDDLRRHNDHMRKSHEHEIESQIADIRRLTHVTQETSELASEQADIIRTKDEKINRLNDELRTLEFKNRTIEDSLNEMNTIREKNKRYFDLLTVSNNELNTMKIELQGIINERNDALEKFGKVERGYIEVREELRKAIEKNERSRELIQEHQAEIRTLKDELDRSHRKLLEKEKEMRNVNEEYLSQSKTTMGYKDETINRLKNDIKQVTRDYENLRREYQEIIERNEDVLVENEKLKQIVFDKELNFNEIEKLNNLNDELLIENEQLKNEKKKIEEEYEKERLKIKGSDTPGSTQRRGK